MLASRALRAAALAAVALCASGGLTGCAWLEDFLTGGIGRDERNVRYGERSRNVLDVWYADGAGPRPALVYFHGGSFTSGDKKDIDPDLVRACLDAGISVVSANYTYSTQAPFPQPMLDGARVVQFLRYRAVEFNLDPARIVLSGISAGGGIALWVGLHDDLANPSSSDLVARQPSRPALLAGIEPQSSYDPAWWREFIRGRAYEVPELATFYGIRPQEYDAPGAAALFAEASPLAYASADDPPMWLLYIEGAGPLPDGPNQNGATLYYPDFGKPLAGFPAVGLGIHNGLFGVALDVALEPLGVEVDLHAIDEFAAVNPGAPGVAAYADLMQFIQTRLP